MFVTHPIHQITTEHSGTAFSPPKITATNRSEMKNGLEGNKDDRKKKTHSSIIPQLYSIQLEARQLRIVTLDTTIVTPTTG